LGFICGGAIGSWLFLQLGFWALSIPAVVCLLLAALYRFVAAAS
jgi:uncharacterized membrane protein YccC